MNNIFGGGGGDGSDPSLGGGDPTGGSDLGTMLSSIGQAFTGGGGGATGPVSSPVAAVNAVQQATDPTGTVAATNAITGGQAPQQTQNQSPQGPNQGGQSGNQDQFAPPNAVEALKKALQGLRQQQRQNPYGFPGGTGNAAAGQNSPMLNRAGRIPTDAVPDKPAEPDDPNAPSQYASNMEFMNDNTPPPSGIDPADAVRAGLRSNAPDTSGQFKMPGPANENAPSENFPAFLKNLREGGGAAAPPPEAPAQTAPSAPAMGGGGGGGILGGLAGLAPGSLGELIARMAGPAGVYFGNTTPAETGELTPGQVGMNYRPEDDPQAPTAQPKENIPIGGGEGNKLEAPTGSVTKAPKTGKPIKTVDPKTNKPVDPKTGAPLPTHKGPLPTKTGEYQPATGNARDKVWRPDTPTGMDQEAGPIMRDISGVSTGVPQQLGELAKMAMPLMMMALGGMGGGGGGRGRHFGRGFGGFGHPGGRGMWPYHHPNFGWGMHGFHPGGGWRPMHPVHFRQMGGGGGPMSYAGGGQGGMTGNPAVDAILQGIGGGGGGGGQGGGGGGQQGGGGGGGGGGGEGGGGISGGADDNFRNSGLGDNPLINTLVGQESGGGQNIVSRTDADSHGLTLAQGGNPDEISSGYFQIQNHGPRGTWQTYGRQAGIDLNKYPTPRSAPIDVQWKVASLIPIGQWGHDTQVRLRQRGFNYNPNTPLGQVAQANGGVNLATAPGTTPTGGTKTPNPGGNDITPPAIVGTQMGPESVAAQ